MANTVTWTSPHGNVINLTDEGAGFIVTPGGTKGLRSVSYELSTNEFATVDGSAVRAIRAVSNEPTLGLQIRANGEEELYYRMQSLTHEMLPQAGLGKLTIKTPWGTDRSLDCYCIGGMEGDEDLSITLPGRWFKTILKFYAPDPWWYGPTKAINVGLGELPSFFPFFPMRLAPSTVQGEFEVKLHDTDAPAYARWIIHGPGSNLRLENLTTHQTIEVATTLAAGDRLMIDTRPGHQSVRRFTPDMIYAPDHENHDHDHESYDEGINEMAAVQSDPALWPLIVGRNRVTAQLTGATAESRVTATYLPRYAGF